MDVMDDAVIAMDASCVVTAWNHGAERIYGRSANEVLGKEVSRVVRLEMSDAQRTELRRLTALRGSTRVQTVAIGKNGNRVRVEMINKALYDEGGAVSGYVGRHRVIGARKGLEDEQRRLASIAENFSDFVAFAELDGSVRFLNEAGQRMVGLNGLEEVRRTTIADYFSFEDHVMPTVMDGGRWSGDLVLRHFETGAEIPVFSDIFRVDDPSTGAPIGVGAITRDLSAQWQRERALQQSQHRTETILESVTDAFYALDRDWRYTYVNERALQMMATLLDRKVVREDILGQSVWALFPELIGTPPETYLREALREQKTIVYEHRYYGQRWFDVRIYPSEDGLSIYIREITDQKRAVLDLERSARQQAAVAQLGVRALASHSLAPLMDEAVALVSQTLGVDLVSIIEILPDRETLLLRAGIGWEDGVVGRATARAGPESLTGYSVMTGEPVISEDLIADERFEISPLLVRHGPESGVTVVIGGRDEPFGALGVFPRRRRRFAATEVDFLQAVANVLATAVERAQAASSIAAVREAEHRGIARELHDDALQELDESLAQAKAAGVTSVVPALERVGNQLRAAIYDLRLGEEQDRPFAELMETLVELNRGLARGEIDLVVSDDVPTCSLGARGTEVLRIVGEALVNARHHANARHVRVEVRASADRLCVDVSDDGRGFDSSSTPSSASSGGIGAMRERAALVNGELDIVSEPGGGTRVRLQMPLSDRAEDAAENVRVLLVEDHTAVREALAAALEREAGFEVVGQAASLAEARTLFEQVDVAVVDLGLPDGYGGDLIAELRRVNPRAQALVLSASLDHVELAHAIESGAAGALSKTAGLDEVVSAVRRVRAGEPLLPMDEVVELLNLAGRRREQEREDRAAIASLTPREREVLQALAEGLDSQQAADRLHIKLRTQRNHVANILAKLGVHSQLQALVFALRYGLVEIR
jgi:PAS domain S-box-containing protein